MTMFKMTAKDFAQLTAMVREEKGDIAHRAQLVLWVSKGKPLKEVLDYSHYTEATARKWLERFGKDGVQGLYDKARGRPRKRTV
jgi:transposase